MSDLTIKDVEYVASLAQLHLDEAAKERMLGEMRNILGYVEQLGRLDTDGVEPMMHAIPMTNVFRNDELGESLSREEALKNAPSHDDEYFLVPKILDPDE